MRYQRKFRRLGTDIYITLVSDRPATEKAQESLDKTEEFYSRFEEKFSRFNRNSELSIFNANLGKEMTASDGFVFLCKKSIDYNKETGGLFDPRVLEPLELLGYRKDFTANDFSDISLVNPDYFNTKIKNDIRIKKNSVVIEKPIDFGGIAKGYATDKASFLIKKNGWKNFIVDSGGDIFASGQNEKNVKWKIAIEGFSKKKIAFRNFQPSSGHLGNNQEKVAS